MENNDAELTHEEVWDDSALIDSWNQALDEYKKYHSIHAKGGSIKDLEQKANPTSTATSVPADGQDYDTAISDEARTPNHKQPIASALEAADHEGVPQPNRALPGPPPQALLGSVRDESLKKLLMAWYYAGYYTGLFEGQQQQSQPEKRSPGS